MADDAAPSSVFFSNVPGGTALSTIRRLFETAGRVVGCRFLEQARRKPGDDTLAGFCDFADALSANAAVRALAGYVLDPATDAKLAVKLAERKKRDRDGAAETAVDDEDAAEFVPSSLALPGDPVQVMLTRLPKAELYEAVAQLQLLAVEHPDAARALLFGNPQLRYAVTLTLQEQGALPATLPPEAFTGEEPAPSSPLAGSAGGGGGTAVTDAAVAAVEQLSEEELMRLLALTPADIAALPAAERAMVEALQPQLRALLNA